MPLWQMFYTNQVLWDIYVLYMKLYKLYKSYIKTRVHLQCIYDSMSLQWCHMSILNNQQLNSDGDTVVLR